MRHQLLKEKKILEVKTQKELEKIEASLDKLWGSNIKEKTSSDIDVDSHKIVCQRIYREIQPSLNIKCDVCVLSSYKNLFLFALYSLIVKNVDQHQNQGY